MAIKELFFEGKTIEAAVEAAAAELGEDKDLLSYVVEETPTKGFLGFGATPAKIKVEITVPDPKPEKKKPAPAWEPEKIAKKDKKPAEKKAEKKPAEKKAEPKKATITPAMLEPEKINKKEEKKPAAPLFPEVEKKPVDDENSKKIIEFLNGLLVHIGAEEDSAVKVELGEDDHYYVEVSGAKMGVLIGRRGETLDAAQYLCSLVINKGNNDKLRVTIDTENYRAKRIKTLQSLAEKNAEKAIKYKRNITMEPMSPYERRIIHAALNGRDRISTFSVGSEPKRRVVVSYKK